MHASFRKTFDNPFGALRNIDRVINNVWDQVEESVGKTGFPVDITERGDTLVVEAELPGFGKDQIDVSVEQGVLTIEAQRGTPDPQAEANVHLSERRTTHRLRRFTLPSAYDTNRVDAKLADGVLTLTLPKRDESKPKKVEVK